MKKHIYTVSAFFIGVICGSLIFTFVFMQPAFDERDTLVRIPTTTEATELVMKNWPDFVDLKCGKGESICPKLNVNVTFGEWDGEKIVGLDAYVTGYGDDSYSGKRRVAGIEWVNGGWKVNEYTDFVMCRNGMFVDNGEVVCH